MSEIKVRSGGGGDIRRLMNNATPEIHIVWCRFLIINSAPY